MFLGSFLISARGREEKKHRRRVKKLFVSPVCVLYAKHILRSEPFSSKEGEKKEKAIIGLDVGSPPRNELK